MLWVCSLIVSGQDAVGELLEGKVMWVCWAGWCRCAGCCGCVAFEWAGRLLSVGLSHSFETFI